jgi:uncharacterized protein YjbI with pentapeptide repeats
VATSLRISNESVTDVCCGVGLDRARPLKRSDGLLLAFRSIVVIAALSLSGCLVSPSSVIRISDGVRVPGSADDSYCRLRETLGLPSYDDARQGRLCTDFRWSESSRSYISSRPGEDDEHYRVLRLLDSYYLVETTHDDGVMLLLLVATEDAFVVHWFELGEFEEVRLAAERHRVRAKQSGEDIALEASNAEQIVTLMRDLVGIVTDKTPRQIHVSEEVLADDANGTERYHAALQRLFPPLGSGAPRDRSRESLALDLRILQISGNCPGCILKGAKLPPVLAGADLSAADLTGANLTGVNLTGAKLRMARLNGAVLQGVRLGGADLSRAALRSADLRDPGALQADIPFKSLSRGGPSADVEMMKLKRAIDRRSQLQDLLAQGVDVRELPLLGKRTGPAAKVDLPSRDEPDPNLLEDNTKLRGQTAGEALPRTSLTGAMLVGADLREARLLGADLRGAILSGADATGADFQLTDLRDARLVGTVLDGVDLTYADLAGADFSMASVGGALFEPQTLPRVETTATVTGLETLRWERSQHALIGLRDAYRSAGMREQERKVTYALKYWERRHTGGIEGLFNYLLFELTSDYGMSPGRPLWCILVFILAFSFFYMFPVQDRNPGKAGIWRIWAQDRVLQDEGTTNPERVQVRGVKVPLWGLYFSLLSAFHIGWREMNVGNWIARISPHEYVLRGTGWVKVVSGIQSLITVYLLALWALTYFGRPFA